MNSMTIAIDIGNTYARFGLIDAEHLVCIKRCSCSTVEIAERAAEMFTNLMSGRRELKALPVFISTVVHARTSQLERLVRSFPEAAGLTRVRVNSAIPFEVRYEFPNLLGADRIANALYAFRVFPGKNVCIIDAGTAVTVDYLSAADGFLGGAILPGLATQMGSLHKATAALPALKPSLAAPRFPGKSTEECIGAGVVLGVAGAVSFIVERLKAMAGEGMQIMTCGGEWPLIAPWVDFSFLHAPDCTLIGTGIFKEEPTAEPSSAHP
jgi:type III pantothenate kinase